MNDGIHKEAANLPVTLSIGGTETHSYLERLLNSNQLYEVNQNELYVRLSMALSYYERRLAEPYPALPEDVSFKIETGKPEEGYQGPPYPPGFPVVYINGVRIDAETLAGETMEDSNGNPISWSLAWRFSQFTIASSHRFAEPLIPDIEIEPHLFDPDLFILGSAQRRRILNIGSYQQETALIGSNKLLEFPDQWAVEDAEGHTLMVPKQKFSSFTGMPEQADGETNFMIDTLGEALLDRYGGTALRFAHSDCGEVDYAHFHQLVLPETVTEEELVNAIDYVLEYYRVGRAVMLDDGKISNIPRKIEKAERLGTDPSRFIGKQLTYESIAADNQKNIGEGPYKFPQVTRENTDLIDERISELYPAEKRPSVFLQAIGKVSLDMVFMTNPNCRFGREVAHMAIHGKLESDDEYVRFSDRRAMFQTWADMVHVFAERDNRLSAAGRQYGYETLAFPPDPYPPYIAGNWYMKQSETEELQYMMGTI